MDHYSRMEIGKHMARNFKIRDITLDQHGNSDLSTLGLSAKIVAGRYGGYG